MLESDISVVHLSDWHIRSDEDIDRVAKPEVLAESIRAHATSQILVIALTGDIAYSGLEPEYALAKAYIERLVTLVAADYACTHVLVLPGNHDLDFTNAKVRDLLLQGILLGGKHPAREALAHLSKEQAQFFDFSASYSNSGFEWTEPHLASLRIQTPNGNLEIVGINTSICSVIHEVPGNLFIDDDLPARTNDVSCRLVLMHHPLHWLNQEIRRTTQDWISKSSDIVLTGHEHEFDQIEQSRLNLPAVQYLAATPFLDAKVTDNGLQLINVSMKSQSIQITPLVCQKSGELVARPTITKTLTSVADRLRLLRPSQAFLDSLESLNLSLTHKSGRRVTHGSIFVYPTVTLNSVASASQSQEAEYMDAESLCDRLLLEQKILVVGEEYAGKTFLFRKLYKDLLARGLRPLLVTARNIDSTSLLASLKPYIEDQYEGGTHSAYRSVPKRDRILLLEDIDRLSSQNLDVSQLVEAVSAEFGAIAMSCRELTVLGDPLSGAPNEVFWKLPTYTVAQFGRRKRSELVARWVAHESGSEETRHITCIQLEHKIDELLSQNAIPALPMALTMLLESMDSGDTISESTGAFGYHYQRLILQALTHEQSRRRQLGAESVTDDIAIELLGRTAFRMFESGNRELDFESLRQIAIDMREELLIQFSVNAATDTLLGSGLLKSLNSATIGFPFRYVYEYSLAKLLALWLNNDAYTEQVRALIADMTQEMHKAENASIIIFFTFLTRDSETIRGVVRHAASTFEGVAPCDLGVALDRFLTDAPKPLAGPDPDVRANRQKMLVTQDRGEARSRLELGELDKLRKDSKDSMREIDQAFQCMQVLGQILRAYPTRLTGDDKKVVASECYGLGLRTLSKFLDTAENAKEVVKDYFRKITADQTDVHNYEQFERDLDRHVSFFVQFGALAMVKRIARAVGSVHLKPLYPLITVGDHGRPVKVINRAIGLDLLMELKPEATADLFRELGADKCGMAQRLLQLLVWEYLFLYPVDYRIRSSLLAKMNMGESPAFLANRTRESGRQLRPRE